jgi:uncharacterized protein (TIGR04168 family)
MTFRIGIIGDLHTHWDDVDVRQFNRSHYDLLLFTGDLGGGTTGSSLRMAQALSRLEKNALVMPGNNDTGDIAELAAELSHRAGMKRLAAMRGGAVLQHGSVRLCGYSAHPIGGDGHAVTLIAARPHSMGGPALSFPEHMRAAYGIDSVASSLRRLQTLVDAAPSRELVFLAHNGPVGLGHAPDDMWGCDFMPDGGDWGDRDLAGAIDYARARGKRVLAVIAGHMHLRTRCDRERPWLAERNGTAYVNAARVPRIRASGDDVERHHVAMTLTRDGITLDEVFVRQSGSAPGAG